MLTILTRKSNSTDLYVATGNFKDMSRELGQLLFKAKTYNTRYNAFSHC
jgi:hypothetical protein